MASSKVRSKKHRLSRRLVQVWVSPEMRRALEARARSEDRSLANYVRREFSKLVGIVE